MQTFNKTIASFLVSLLCLSGVVTNSVKGQSDYCATDDLEQAIMENSSPEMKERILQTREELRENWDKPSGQRAGQVYTIPVVFHVVHDNGPENIDRSVVKNAIEQMNIDYRKENADTTSIYSSFKSLATDAEIEFRLAQKDPDGNCHPGITRTKSDLTYGAYDNGIKDLIQWDRSSYLNIWVCHDIGGSVAGYALKPGGAHWNPGEDGIVVRYQSVGTDRHTLTHEAGHYLGLDHPWGGGQAGDGSNCSSDDGIGDTPNTVGWQSCPSPPNDESCTTQDNVQNYMSYSFCHKMFTADQANAMRNTLQSSTADRNQLWTSTNLQETGLNPNTLCAADFKANRLVVCEGASVQFTDRSYHGPTSWNWTFEGGNPSSSTSQNDTVTYQNIGSYDVTLVAANSNGKDTLKMEDYINVIADSGNPLPFVNSLDWIPNFHKHPEFYVENPGKDNVKWMHTDQAGESGSHGCVMLDNHSNPRKQLDAFTTTTMDATGITDDSLELSFDVAYSRMHTSNADELIIYASRNCGDYWNKMRTFSADELKTAPKDSSPFYPIGSQWKHVTVDRSDGLASVFNVKDLRFKFEFLSDGGNNIFIDNINIHDKQNVGIEEADDKNLTWSLYPNPVKERASIDIELSEQKQVDIEILDLRGKQVRKVRSGESVSKGSHRIQMDLSDLESGPYFVRIQAGDQRSTQKLFKH